MTIEEATLVPKLSMWRLTVRRTALSAFIITLLLSLTTKTFAQATTEAKSEAPQTTEAADKIEKPAEAHKIDPEALKRVSDDIRFLAADDLEGRGVQTKGIEVAADYIREEFKKAGVESGTTDGSYYQYFDVSIGEKFSTDGTELALSIDGGSPELSRGKDFQMLAVGGNGEAEAEIVFVGYGISAPDYDYDDYAGIDCEGKIVMMIRREPQLNDEESKFNGSKTTPHSYVATKIGLAKEAGAIGVLFVNDAGTKPDVVMSANEFGSVSPIRMPILHITRETANSLIAASPLEAGDKKLGTLAEIEEYIDSEYKPVSQPLKACSAKLVAKSSTKQVKAWNVIGVVEGEGPHADETVVVGAHYDHLGFGGYGSRARGSSEVHNGADDNATGTAAVIELARRFAKAEKKPARRMVFIAFSGEERGLIGSQYYVENPTYPLDKTVCMLNFDMIGNLRENIGITLGGYGTGSGLQPVAETAAEAVSAKVRLSRGAGGGSDHLRFFAKQIPVMFCNTGLTKLYHTPEDDYETLNLPGCVETVDLCEALLKGVVEMEERPVFSAVGRRRARRPTVFLGIGNRATEGDEGSGVVITRVLADSPAGKAGLKVGDVLRAIGDKKIEAGDDLPAALRGRKPGDKVTLKVVRDGEEKELECELAGPPGRGGRGRGQRGQ